MLVASPAQSSDNPWQQSFGSALVRLTETFKELRLLVITML